MMRPAGPAADGRLEVEGLEIREVTPATAPAFADTLERGFGLAGASASPWAQPEAFGSDLKAFLGYVDGQPVATSAAFLSHGVVDVEMVSCVESHRGTGIGEALTWAATNVAPERPAMLMASDLGAPIYRRMGYVPVLRMTLWHATP
jgi:ribosomal protein S18 acetylase RimI-like enzyme